MATIAVVGAGAVGCYYGALLARAGHDVRFLMRRDLDAVRAHGLEIRSPRGDFRVDPVQAVASPAELGQPDWILLALKTIALGEAEPLLRPCLGPATRVLALMNGLGVEERLAEFVPPAHVFGGMAFVCINRGQPSVVHHLEYGRVSIGHLLDDPDETAALAKLLAGAGIDVAVAPNLRYARWEKLAWNVPFNGLSVACGGVGTETIVRDPVLRRVAETAMRELIAIGNADLAALGSPARIDTDALVARMFALTDSMGDYWTSMALDFAAGRPLESEAILGEPARRAAALGIATPTVAAIYGIVRAVRDPQHPMSRAPR